MIFYLFQGLFFLLLTAACVVRDYPWKALNKNRDHWGYLAFVLALLSLLGQSVVTFSGMEVEMNAFALIFTLVSMAAFFIVAVLAMTVWPRKKRAMETDDQRTV